MLEAARQALENIDKGQLTELKSFASPPETVKFVMNMVGKSKDRFRLLEGEYICLCRIRL